MRNLRELPRGARMPEDDRNAEGHVNARGAIAPSGPTSAGSGRDASSPGTSPQVQPLPFPLQRA